jgi:hypothetical protein
MDRKSIKAWELFFDYMAHKYALEAGIEWIDWYFGSDDDAFWNGWMKSSVGARVN